ncbi:MAG: hypothetical protein GY766_05440 [Herbaspirillum sp.]|uniref:hypothetical protein n=1 Tax=Herbaspirillum sp. TaxID=1890675 RepID=UPI0025841C98|nr:hypothetical protein [Herbaspirillum sp.]MCP3654326.1 hypothetical protein [Herbaspirillum sp.]
MLEQKIAELTKAVEALTATIAAQGVAVDPDAPTEPKADTPTETEADTPSAPSAQDLKDATLKAARSGHKDAIRDKLSSFGVTKIQDLDAGNAVAFYGWVTSLGADQ